MGSSTLCPSEGRDREREGEMLCFGDFFFFLRGMWGLYLVCFSLYLIKLQMFSVSKVK